MENKNLCSIYHAHFNKLVGLTNNAKKAVFLDKCIFWWQISKYTLGDGKIWFTRKIPEIAHELSISERTVSRYLIELENLGFLEKTCKLSASNQEDGFRVTKRLYIRVTEKLLTLLQIRTKDGTPKKETNTSACSFSNQFGKIDPDKLAGSIYKDKDYKQTNNSTVSNDCIVNNLKTPPQKNSQQQTATQYPIEPQIGERISDRLKNYIKGMLSNVQTQHDVSFSDPNKLFAEVVFSVTQEVQWPGVDNPHHRVNIIAKLLRQKQWRTPKGFYNHWDVGSLFRAQERTRFEKGKTSMPIKNQTSNHPLSRGGCSEDASERIRVRVADEYRFSTNSPYEQDKENLKLKQSLQEINLNIRSEESYLKQLEGWGEHKKSRTNQDLIDSIAVKIAKLYEEQQKLISLMRGRGAMAA